MSVFSIEFFLWSTFKQSGWNEATWVHGSKLSLSMSRDISRNFVELDGTYPRGEGGRDRERERERDIGRMAQRGGRIIIYLLSPTSLYVIRAQLWLPRSRYSFVRETIIGLVRKNNVNL